MDRIKVLAPSSKLGPYEILSPLGAGGMGEVYRARETKLGRDVALKVLSEALARDSDRVVRLRHEAEVLASLNHHNIATIRGLEESNGIESSLVTLNLGTKNSWDGWNPKIPVGRGMAKKAARIPDRVYPRDLHGILQRVGQQAGLPRLAERRAATQGRVRRDHARLLSREPTHGRPPNGIPHRLPRQSKSSIAKG